MDSERITQLRVFIDAIEEEIKEYDEWIILYPEDKALIFSQDSLKILKEQKIKKLNELLGDDNGKKT